MMGKGTTATLLASALVNMVMVLVTATNPGVIHMGSKQGETLESLLAEDDLFGLHMKIGRTYNASAGRRNSHVQAAVTENEEEIDLSLNFANDNEEAFMLPTDYELRNHIRRRRQVITDTEGSGLVADGVVTGVVVSADFATIDTAQLKTDAETEIKAVFVEWEVGFSTLTATVTNNQNKETKISFKTIFETVNNRVFLAYVFKKYIASNTIGSYTQTKEPTITNAVGTETTVTCFLCPADRPCVNGKCGDFSTASSSDLFPWGFSTMDGILKHSDFDVTSPIQDIPPGFIFDGTSMNYFHVGDNGIISFTNSETDAGFNSASIDDITAQDNKIISVFCADSSLLHAGRSSEIFYGNYKLGDPSATLILLRATIEVNKYKPSTSNFQSAMWAAVITWFDVPYFIKDSAPTKRNLFQAVLVSDGIESFVLIFYKDMAWPQELQDLAVAGFKHLATSDLVNYLKKKADGDQRLNKPFDELTGNTGLAGYFLLQVGKVSTISDAYNCMSWYKDNYDLKETFITRRGTMKQCPCAQEHILQLNYFLLQSDNSGTKCYDLLQGADTLDSTRCCYNGGARNADLSRYLRFKVGNDAHDNEDKISRENCCDKSNFCFLFNELRPDLSCAEKPSASAANGDGDPHIVTLDSFRYTFNGYGEYTLFEMDYDLETGPGKFKFNFQCRTAPALKPNGDASQATIFTGFAGAQTVKHDASFFVKMDIAQTKLLVYANGQDLSSDFYKDSSYMRAFTDVIISRKAEHKVEYYFSTTRLLFSFALAQKTMSFGVVIDGDYDYVGKTKGLMGNNDKNDKNDLVKLDGTAVATTASNREIFAMGETWRVTSDSTLMVYEPGRSYADHNKPLFEPVFFDEISAAVKAEAAGPDFCNGEGNVQCILDYVVTGNKDLALATQSQQDAADQKRATLANTAPSISGTKTINVEVNNKISLAFTGTDPDGDALTYIVSNKPGTGFTLDGASGSGEWTPSNTDPVQITVSARDARGLDSDQIDVEIVVCQGCANSGTCDYTTPLAATSASTPPTFKLASCSCVVGWGGKQ